MTPAMTARIRRRLERLNAGPLIPATEPSISRVEKALGRALPRSYEHLLRVTDGFMFEWGSSLCGATDKVSGLSVLQFLKSRKYKWIGDRFIPLGLDGWNHAWCLVDELRHGGDGPVCAVPIGGRRVDYVVASTLGAFLWHTATVDRTDGVWRSDKRLVLAADPGIAAFREFPMPWEFDEA